MLSFENLHKVNFEGVGKYGIPEMLPGEYKQGAEWIGFNYARGKKDKSGLSIHFFLDDYQFASVWNTPDRHMGLMTASDNVLSPDFSLYTDTPLAVQIYNHFKKHWIAAYWQTKGVNVIPTISWSDRSSYDWCFDGEPTNSVVAISTVGTQQNKIAKLLFMDGYHEMIQRLKPTQILCYGKIPEEIQGDVTSMGNFYDEMVERRKAKWAEEGRLVAEGQENQPELRKPGNTPNTGLHKQTKHKCKH